MAKLKEHARVSNSTSFDVMKQGKNPIGVIGNELKVGNRKTRRKVKAIKKSLGYDV